MIISSAITGGHGVSVSSYQDIEYFSESTCGVGESGLVSNELVLLESAQGKTVANPQQRAMFFGVN